MMIRSAAPPDRDVIAALLKRRRLFNREEMSVALEVIDAALEHPEKEDYFLFCAGSMEQLDGYICFGPVPLTEGSWDLYWIAVDEGRSRSGVGGRLLTFMEDLVVGRGGRRIYIDTSSTPGYAPARAFYRRNGFHPVCVLKDFYRPGDDKVIFMKTAPFHES